MLRERQYSLSPLPLDRGGLGGSRIPSDLLWSWPDGAYRSCRSNVSYVRCWAPAMGRLRPPAAGSVSYLPNDRKSPAVYVRRRRVPVKPPAIVATPGRPSAFPRRRVNAHRIAKLVFGIWRKAGEPAPRLW